MSGLRAHDPGRGVLRLALRLPSWFYSLGLGWMFGERLLRLWHTGRRSGRRYCTVLEVLRHDRVRDGYIVASGWGRDADWFRNVQQQPATMIDVGRQRLPVRAVVLPRAQAADEFLRYARRHRLAAPLIGPLLLGRRIELTEETCRELAEAIPLVGLYVQP
jgi:deazaflavin-dependent oxidoreductase (nitroreductase family)